MDVSAKVTSKGQVTIPRSVRDALGLADGDQVVFRVEGQRALLARTPNLLDLAGSVSVPGPSEGHPGTRFVARLAPPEQPHAVESVLRHKHPGSPPDR